MPLDPMLAKLPTLQLDDPMEKFGQVMQNALAMEKIGESRRGRERNALRDMAYAANTKNGVVNQQGVTDYLAQNKGGADIPDEQEKWGKVAHLARQTEHEKMLSRKAMHEAYGTILKNTESEMRGVSKDYKKGPVQMLGVFERTHDHFIDLMGKEKADALLQERVAQLKQAVEGGEKAWNQYHANESAGVAAAHKNHLNVINKGPEQVVLRSSEMGVNPPEVIATFKNSVDPRTAYVQSQLNTRQQAGFGQQNVNREDNQVFQGGMQEDRQSHGLVMQGNQFGQQNRIQQNQFDNQLNMLNRRTEIKKTEAQAKIEAKQAEVDEKYRKSQVSAGSLVAQAMKRDFPWLDVRQVNSNTGEVILNIPKNISPREIEKLKRAGSGIFTLEEIKGMPPVMVLNAGQDINTLRAKLKDPKLVADPNNRLVEARVGQEIRGANSASAPKRPDFDKKAREAIKLRKSSGMFSPRNPMDLEMALTEEYNNAVATHNQMTGDSVPFKVPQERTGPGNLNAFGKLTAEALKWNEWVQKERLRQSQIHKNNAAAERVK